MPATILRIEAHVIDIRREGWCPTCALPSVLTVELALVWPDSLKVWSTFTRTFCPECGE